MKKFQKNENAIKNYYDSTKSEFDNFVDNILIMRENGIDMADKGQPSRIVKTFSVMHENVRKLGNSMNDAKCVCFKTFAHFMTDTRFYESLDQVTIYSQSPFYQREVQRRLVDAIADFLKKPVSVLIDASLKPESKSFGQSLRIAK